MFICNICWCGFCCYFLANVEIDDASTELPSTYDSLVSAEMGGLMRASCEWGKFRMGVEYNLLQDSDVESFSGEKVGEASNAYVGIHLGFFLGGGKCEK